MKIYNTIRQTMCYVPNHTPVTNGHLCAITEFFINNRNTLVLTGAGVSTESGIPDYRSEGVGLFARNNTKPIQYQDFVKYPKARQRYWARNFVGWSNFSNVKPNKNHTILKSLEDIDKVCRIITQNVDSLHTKAGSENVIELHGTAFIVTCLSCNYKIERQTFQEVLYSVNKQKFVIPQLIRPDGDVDIPQELVEDFKIPSCPDCGSVLKPDIVFFGDNVPKWRVDEINDQIDKCDSLLILGSSLSTYSGYRIALRAKELNKNLCIINIGPTRGDSLSDFKINTKCSEVLEYVQKNLL